MIGRAEVGLGFRVNKSGLVEVQKLLRNIQASADIDMTPQMHASIKAAETLEKALNQAMNPDTGQIDLNSFNRYLRNAGVNAEDLKAQLGQAGVQGQIALSKLNTELSLTGTRLKENNKWLNEMATTLRNSLRWSAASAAIREFTQGVSDAFTYVKRLNSSLRDIQVVSGYSSEYMKEFAASANEAAKAIGLTTLDFTEAALIYIQQGKREDVVNQLSDITLRAAQVVGTSTKDMSEYLTAVWNGFQIGAEDAEAAVDKLAAVAANTGADLEELTTGMSKVASVAKVLGMDLDQLNAAIATVVTVTRQAPESVGTAFKTILARLEEVKLGETLEDGVNLGQVGQVLDKIGVKILDTKGELRDIGTVVEEIGNKWDTLSVAQQNAVAIVMAGKRQYNNLLALFDNWDMYMDAVNISANSLGTLQEQHEIYLQSITAYEHKLNAEMEALYSNVISEDAIKSTYAGITKLTEGLNATIESLGGIQQILPMIASMMVSAFSPKIALNLDKQLKNLDTRYRDLTARVQEYQAKRRNEEYVSPEQAGLNQRRTEQRAKIEEQYSQGKINNDERVRQLALIEQAIGREEAVLRLKREEQGLIKNATQAQRESLISYDREIASLEAKLRYERESKQLTAQQLADYENYVNLQRSNNKANLDRAAARMDAAFASNVRPKLQDEQQARLMLEMAKEQLNLGNMETTVLKQQLNEWIRIGAISEGLQGDLQRILYTSNSLVEVQERLEASALTRKEYLDKEIAKIREQLAITRFLTDEDRQQLETRLQALLATRNNVGTEANILQLLQRQRQERETQLAQIRRQQRLQRNIQIANVSAMMVSSMAISFETIANESANAEEKANSLLSGIANGASAAAFALGPLKGSLVLIGASLLKTIIKATGAFEVLENFFKTGKERVKEYADEVNNLTNTIESASESLEKINEQLERYNELVAKQRYGKLSAEEREELEVLEAQTENLKLQKEIKEAQIKASKEQAKIELENARNIELENRNAKQGRSISVAEYMQGTDSDYFNYSLSGTTEEQAQQLAEEYQKYNEKVTDIFTEINTKALYSDLSDLSKEVIGLYLQTLDGSSKELLDRYISGDTFNKMESNQLTALLGSIDVGKLGAYDTWRKSLEDNVARIEPALQELQTAAEALGIDTQEYADISNIQLDLLRAKSNNVDNAGQLAKKSLLELDKSLDTFKEKEIVSDEQTKTLEELSKAFQDLKNGVSEEEVFKNLQEAGIEIDSNLAHLETNIVNLASTLSNDLYQSIAKDISVGKLSIDVFNTLGDAFERLTNVGKSSQIIANPDSVAEIYEKILSADSASEVQIAGSNLEGWETVKDASLKQQLAYVREYYKEEVNLQRVSQYQQLESLKASIQEKQAAMNEAQINYEAALEGSDQYLKDWTKKTYEDAVQSFVDTTGQARDLANELTDGLYATAADYQNAFDAIYNEGDFLGAEEAWSFLKDLPNYEDYFYEGTASILLNLIEQGDKTNEAIIDSIEKYQQEIDELNIQKAYLEPAYDDKSMKQFENDTEEIEAQIESLERKITDAQLDLSINTDFEQTAKQIHELGGLLDDFYNSIHDGNTLTKQGYKLTYDQLEQVKNLYPQLVAEHGNYIDNVLYLDQVGTDAFLQSQDAKLNKVIQNKQAEIDAEITVLEGNIKALESRRNANNITIGEIATMHQQAAEYEIGLERDKQGEYDTTNDQAGTVAEDISTNFANAGDSVATSMSNMTTSVLGNLQKIGKEARNVAEQIANLDTPIYEPGEAVGEKNYTPGKTITKTKNSKTLGMTDFIVQLQEARDAVTVATQEQVDAELEYEKNILGILKATKGQLGTQLVDSSGLNLNRTNKDLDKAKKGSKKKDSKKERELVEAEKDIYHQVNEELERQESILGTVRTQKEQLYGKDYLGALEAEKSYLESINKLNKQKLEMQKEDLSTQRAALSAQGVTFDENGVITNYNDIIAKKAAQVNAIKDEKAFEKAKAEYEAFLKAIEKYEDLFKDFYALQQDIIDIQAEIMAANLETIVKKIEFDLQPTKDTISYLEFLNSFYENDFYQSGESVERLGQIFLETVDSLEVYKNGIEELQAAYAAGEITAADFNSEVRAQKDAMQDAMLSLAEIEEQIENAYGEALSEAEDKISKFTNTLEHYNGIMEHFISLMDLIGEGHEYRTIADMYDAQSDNYMSQLRVQQDWLNNLYIQKQLLEETGQEGTKAWFEVREAIEEVEDQIYSLAENALQALKDSYLNTIDAIIDELDNKITQSSIGSMLTQYERDRDLGSVYYDKPTQLYEIDTLQKDIEKSMDNITNKLQKQKLQGLHDELEIMRELDHISEYDLERKKAEYEILLAQMALEDAQNNKQIMRLTRTSQGTREYTFTADAASVDEATSEVTKAYNNLYELSLKHMQDLEQQILDTTSAYEEELTELYKDWADGKFASEDEFYRERDALVSYYEAKITDLTARYNKVREENALDAADLITQTSHRTGEALIQQIEENKNQFNEAVADMTDRIGGDHGDSFRGMSRDTIAELDEAWSGYNDNIDRIKNEVDINLEDMANRTSELRDESDSLAQTISSDVVPALQNEIEEVINATAAHRAEAEALRDKIQAYLEWLGLLSQDMTGSGNKKGEGDEQGLGYNTDFAREALLTYAQTKDVDLAMKSVDKRIAKIQATGAAVNTTGEYDRFNKMFDAMSKNAELMEKVVDRLNKGYTTEQIRSLFGFDTGGYTGDWGSTKGRLAVLHEKELVLNKGDTANMLEMLEITRQVVAQASVMGAYKSGILNTSNVVRNISNINDTSNQQIIVYADFPNATNQSEIEAALLSIQTDASQYSARKK